MKNGREKRSRKRGNGRSTDVDDVHVAGDAVTEEVVQLSSEQTMLQLVAEERTPSLSSSPSQDPAVKPQQSEHICMTGAVVSQKKAVTLRFQSQERRMVFLSSIGGDMQAHRLLESLGKAHTSQQSNRA